MKAGILYGANDIRLGDVPDPEINPNEVLVKSMFAGICGTDLHVFRGEFEGRVAYPAIQGHEFGGIIEEIGSEVTRFKVGDRVAIDPIMPCHSCETCLTGHINACRNLKLLGIDLNGGFGQYVAAPEFQCYLLPDNVPMEHAPMVELYGLGQHILQRGMVQPGETVALLGAGKLGLCVLDVLCHSASPGLAIAVDLLPIRLDTAKKLGVDEVVNLHEEDAVERVMALTNGVGVDVVIETVGHFHEVGNQEAPLAQAVKMIRNGGRIVTCGLGEQLTPVHFKTLVIKEASIIASRVTLGEYPRALRMMAKGLLHPELLITQTMPMRDVTEAFSIVDRDDPDTIKIVLDTQAI